MSQIYRDRSETLADILEKAGSGQGATLLIPDLQRPYVWTPKQVIYLVDSLVRGWPFGSLLLWSVGSDDLANMPSRQFSRMVARDHGLTDSVSPRHAPAEYQMILDGQQRVQSLLLAFGGDGWGFKLEDRTWREAMYDVRSRGRRGNPHWSMGELCVDLVKLADEFERASHLSAVEFDRVLDWVVMTQQNGQSAWKKAKNYEEPLKKKWEHPGRFVRLSRFWEAFKAANPSNSQIGQAGRKIIEEHGVDENLSNRVSAAVNDLVGVIQSIKSTRVTFLELNRYSGEDMGKPEDYNDAIVSIFTRLNTAGRTLTREEISFAWIKSGWAESATPGSKGAGECFSELATALEAKASIKLDTDSLVSGVCILWGICFNGGKLLSNSDLLKGDQTRPMAAQIAKEWPQLSTAILEVSQMIAARKYEFGKHYQSLNSLALLWAWWFAFKSWRLKRPCRQVEQDEWDLFQNSAFTQNVDRWIISSQWAGRWAGSASTHLESFCSKLSAAVSLMDSESNPALAATTLTKALESIIDTFNADAVNHLETLEADSREFVRGYFLPLWLWHRLDSGRWESSQLPLRSRKKNAALEVDHIVSVGYCADKQFSTEPALLEETDEANEPAPFVNVNALGNCWLLEKGFNIAKGKSAAAEFLKEISELQSEEKFNLWKTGMGLSDCLLRPTSATAVADEIVKRTALMKEDLKRFVNGHLRRADL
jgi:hypothetical protein